MPGVSKQSGVPQLPSSVWFMNGLSTRKVGRFHEKSHPVHGIEKITDRTEQILSAKCIIQCGAHVVDPHVILGTGV
jgi:hypothetical protein